MIGTIMSHVLVITAGEVLILRVVNFQSSGIVNEIKKIELSSGEYRTLVCNSEYLVNC